jgi:SAM-dependent methyltransferase
MSSQALQDQFELLDRFVRERPDSVADLGAGLGHHTERFLRHGLPVLAVDRVVTPELAGIAKAHAERCRLLRSDIGRLPVADGAWDAIWASHCLEHMLDPLAVLAEWRRVLKPDGWLAVLVPPYKTEVVGRHVFTGWNVGQLMMTLFRAGYRVRDGIFAQRGYNVFALVHKCPSPPRLEPNDEILCQYNEHFPPQIECEILEHAWTNAFGDRIGRFQGNIDRLGW